MGLDTQWCLSADQKYFHFSGACACAVHRTYDITTQAEAQAKEGESCVCLRSPFTLNFSCAYAYAYAYACIVRVKQPLRMFAGIVSAQLFCACSACHFHLTSAVSVQHSIANFFCVIVRGSQSLDRLLLVTDVSKPILSWSKLSN